MTRRWRNSPGCGSVLIGLLAGFLCMSQGCVGLAVGGAAVVGTYAVVHDYVTTAVDTSFENAWSAANRRLAEIGAVDDSQQKLGEIKAVVDNADVRVAIRKVTDRTVDIRVAARQDLIPRLDLARSILSYILRGM